VVRRWEELGVDSLVEYTADSTRLRLLYPSDNPDERLIFVDSSAGPIRPDQLAGLSPSAAVVGASFRGEVGLDVLRTLKEREARIALDVQGFVRSVRDGRLVAGEWPDKAEVLALVQFLKADIAEAEMLTGSRDLRLAARELFGMGAREIVLTHRDGLLVYDGRGFYEAGFYPRKLVGRSGRGDTCIAAYACRRLTTEVEEATIWAAAITSLKMESNTPFHASLREVEHLIRRRYAP
jgi:sugar/nucleoside kinase (ribokinase family)